MASVYANIPLGNKSKIEAYVAASKERKYESKSSKTYYSNHSSKGARNPSQSFKQRDLIFNTNESICMLNNNGTEVMVSPLKMSKKVASAPQKDNWAKAMSTFTK